MESEMHGRDGDPARCAHCGAPLTAADSFCAACGQPVPASAADDQRLARLSARAPQALAEKLKTSTSEGKTVTTLCATLSVSGAALSADERRAIMDRALDRFAARIYRYEGAIARLVGDGPLAFFGAPITHEDDPRRAVHAALELLADAREMADDLRRSGVELAVRVGVHSGAVIVARDLTVGDNASADTVNLAVQLQAVAPPMTVLLTRETYRYVQAFFECADLGTVALGAKPVEVYEALRAKAGNIQGRGIVGLETIFVGRAAELDRLRSLSSAVQAGLGRVALILGEPGLGKSRMLSEWRAGQTMRWIEGQCQSFAQGFPYQLVTALLRSLLGVGEADAEAALKAQTARFFGADDLEVYPYLAHLLGISLDGAAADRVEQLDPQTLAQHYADAFRRLLAATTAKAPAAVICEDIHWADSSSVELLTKLLPTIPVTRVLFCFSSRPERDVPGWRIVTAARELLGDALTEIQLKPLSDSDSQQLLSTLLNANALPPQVMEAVRGKAEGNPFFVEELVRTLIEDGTIRHEGGVWISEKSFTSAHVPDNLSGLLLARIDRQPDAVKQALRVASVIGRQFSVRVLQQVLDLDESAVLMTRLNALETASLIQLAQVEPELEYRFRHALLQEASYDSLLQDERRRLHQAVGRALETLYPERLHELAATLGHHLMEAGEQADARKYYLLAAEYAERMYANAEAIADYTHVLALLDPSDPARVGTLRERGALYERVGDFDASRADYEAALEQARQNEDRRGEWQALIDLGALWATNDYLQTGDYYQHAYEVAQMLEEPQLIASALNRLGNWHVNRETPGTGIQLHEQALKLFEEQQDQMGILETVDLLSMAEMLVADFTAAQRYADRSLLLARALGVKHLQAVALSTQAFGVVELDITVAPPARPFAETAALLDESIGIVRSMGWRSYEAFFGGWFAFLWGRMGEYAHGVHMAEDALALAREIGHRQWQIQASLTFAQIYLDMCAPALAREIAQAALEQARQINSLYWLRVMSAILTLAHLRLGELDQAEALLAATLDFSSPPATYAERWLWMARIQLELARDHFEAAIQMLDVMLAATPDLDARGEGGILMMSIARGKALLGLMRSGKGTPAELAAKAEAALRAAETVAEGHEVRSTLWRVNAALGELYRYLMRPEDAEAEFAKARAIVEKIAATAPDDDLRAQLLRGAAEEWSNLRGDLNYRVVKGYQIRETISSGGFGVVYRAYQPVVDREVAVKVIRPQFANQPEFVRRFEAEAHLVARLEHPYIVPLYDYWHDADGAFLVMRFIRGGSLREALRGGALPFERVVGIAEQVSSALAAAHRQGVIHRDIKPDNILLDEDGNAYLTDFGIAKITGLNRITADEGISGSLQYISPEQISGEAVSPQTDIYGLGIVLYEALVGQHPFADATPAQIIFRHLETPLPDFAPYAASEVIQKATRKNPAERYASAPEFAQALRAALVGEQKLATPPSASETPASHDEETKLGYSPGDAPTT